MMKGYLYNLRNNKDGKLFGNILGDDKNKYYFICDYQYFIAPQEAENLHVGDILEFEPFIKYPDRGPWARKISVVKAAQNQPEISSEPITASGYYPPGYSKSITRSLLLKRFLKPHSNEIDVLDRFSELLRISYVNTHDLGGGDMFPFCIMGATEILKQYMGKYEFLLVFSHFDSKSWQENSLRAINAIRKRKEVVARRPLVNFYILVSNANSFKEEIDRVKGGTDSAIIPFSFNEILECRDKSELLELVLGRFEEYYYENNMLGEKNAIEEDALLFGDRDKIADSITQRSIEKKYSGIFGLRRSGKTSVLKAVERRLESQSYKYVVIESRTELKDIESWHIALYDIARRIRIATTGLVQKDDENRREFNDRLKLNSTEDDYLRRPTQSFIEDVALYTRNLPTFVIAIDEIELITYNTATSAVWRDLDAYHGFFSALRDCKCALIFCGVNSTINEKSRIVFNGKTCDNPMYERIHNCADFSKTYLPAFSDAQTLHMINELGGYSNIAFDDVYTDINHAFGGQPYAIRQFCSYAYEQVKHHRVRNEPFQLTKATYDGLIEEFYDSQQGRDLFDTILEHVTIYVDEFEMLKKLALSPNKYRKIGMDELPLIDHLIKYGLIERDRITGYVTFNINAIQQHIQKTMEKRPEDMDNTERRRYVQDYVRDCERKLKKYILDYYMITGNEAAGKAAFNKRAKPNPSANPTPDFNLCSLREIFDHTKFLIYFSTLRTVIDQNWKTLGAAFERSGLQRERFNVSMKDINAGRNDADHYDPEDMTCPEIWDIDNNTLQAFMTAKNNLDKFFSYMNI